MGSYWTDLLREVPGPFEDECLLTLTMLDSIEVQTEVVALLLFEGRMVVLLLPASAPIEDFRRVSGDGSWPCILFIWSSRL